MTSSDPLKQDVLEGILERLPSLCVAVVGDLFLDRYLDLDAALTEPSLETGLDAYQVVRVRAVPGATGTVINNLVALGVGRILAVAIVGDDGEGYELRRALDALGTVDCRWVSAATGRRTPTYTKPLLHESGRPPRELNRLDIKNRNVLSAPDEAEVLRGLADAWTSSDALVVLDQVSEPDCGVVTARVRHELALLGAADPGKPVLADSREQIGLFRSVAVKPNARECIRAVRGTGEGPRSESVPVRELCRQTGRVVYCTLGGDGILLAEPESGMDVRVPAFPVFPPIDPVGAGDSTSAGIVCALSAGTTPVQAAAFGNLVASVTVQQFGTTGTASPDQLRSRWRETHAFSR